MDIVISTDNAYVMPAGILIYSVCQNNVRENIYFHVLTDTSLTEANRQALKNITDFAGKTIYFHNIDPRITQGCPVGRDGLPVSAYYRLYISDILPEKIKKVLYLDCDMIVRHSLNELWKYDIENYAIGCVPDMFTDDISSYNRLLYSPSEGYFNSGMLLINLDYWRKHKVKNAFIDFISNYSDRILYSDQDVMNYVLRKQKLNLPLRYNVQDGFLWKYPKMSWTYFEELAEAVSNPTILHYNTRNKPWIKGCDQPLKDEFFKYRSMTQWAKEPLWPNTSESSLKKSIKTVLRKLGVMTPVPSIYRNDIKPL